MESNVIPSSSQDATVNSQISRGKTDPAWEHVYEERYASGKKILVVCIVKSYKMKGGDIHRMKQYLASMKEDMVHVNRFLLILDFE